MRLLPIFAALPLCLSLLLTPAAAQEAQEGASVVEFFGYDDCIRLENSTTRVTLCPAAGGRVLEYTLNDVNALYLPEEGEGWTYEPSPRGRRGRGGRGGAMNAGRFDIGPEQTIPSHPLLWMGRWEGEITGPRSARLTSQEDPATGVQLIREFTLAADSSRLECRQTIRNVSDETVEYCHWARTFALGGGICVIPLTEPSRFPNFYVMYPTNSQIDFRPEDPNIRRRDGFLEILAAPQFAKLGMDTYAGWFAYLEPSGLMFVKQFPTYPDRVYNEVAGLTMSVWYPVGGRLVELEPIGPRERLAPGESASFTETWYLLPHAFPAEGEELDLGAIAGEVEGETN